MKRYLLLALTAVPVVIAFGSGCKKAVPTVEAGVESAAVVEDAAPPAVAEADAAPAPTLTTTAKHVATAAKSAAPVVGPFQGTYSCFAGMSVTQTGDNVTARQKPGDTQNYATVACTANGDNCEGSTTFYVGGKPSGTKKSSMKRGGSGDITYKAEGEAPTLCHKK